MKLTSSVDLDKEKSSPKEILINTIFNSLDKKLGINNRNTHENIKILKPIVKGICSKVIGFKVDLLNQIEIKRLEDQCFKEFLHIV